MISLFLLGLALAAPIDLDAAVARAEEAGLDARSAQLAVEAAERTLRTRKLAAGPDVRLSASAGAGVGAGWSTEEALLGADTAARVSASVPVWTGGELRGERYIAGRALAQAEAEREQTRQDLVWTLAGALLDLESARAATRTAEEALAAEEALLARVRALVGGGARTRADALSQEAAVARQRSALVAARREVAARELFLEELLRLDDAEFVAPVTAPAAEGAERPGVRARREALDAAERAVTTAGASGRPQVDLGVSASTGWAPGEDATALSDRAQAGATLDFSVPLWDREVTRHAVEQARIARESARLALEDAERAVRTDVALAEVDVEAARAGLEAARARAEAARAAAAVVEQRYEAGAALLTELLAARAERVDADTALAQAEVEVVRAGFGLAWARGAL